MAVHRASGASLGVLVGVGDGADERVVVHGHAITTAAVLPRPVGISISCERQGNGPRAGD